MGTWKCFARFDDAHGYRHCDFLDYKELKMPIGPLFKIECPILSAIINSLPKDKADMWKVKLFDEFEIARQEREQLFEKLSKGSHRKNL